MLVDFDSFLKICKDAGLQEPVCRAMTISYLMGKVNGYEELIKEIYDAMTESALKLAKPEITLIKHLLTKHEEESKD